METQTTVMSETAVEPLTALYVGDLDEAVTLEQLKYLFNQIGDVDSVKICTDQTTGRSLGYGYVNYSNPQHAAKALEVLNFTTLNGRHIRVSYSNRDGSQRKSGLGNIFIKNLDKEIDSRSLRDMFSKFGTILSSKVETDSSGLSKGYGFVHYGNEEASRKAIESLNGTLICGKELFVGPFLSKQEREMSMDKTKFTNVFVKNLSRWTTEEHLRSIFGEFGPTNSIAVMRDETGNSKGFAFVHFEKSEDAVKSVEMLNGRIFSGKKWYVGRAQKKYEREQELKAYHQQLATEARERMIVSQNNLYIKNIDEKIDNDKLKSLFSSFGTIISCKIMFDPKGISKGYGFVAFSTTQEASKAILEMNGKMVGNKPLYVAIAEKKEVRHQRLQFIFSTMRPTAMVPPDSPRMPIYASSGFGQSIFYPLTPPVVIPPMSRFNYQQPPFMPPPLLPNVVFPIMHRGLHGPHPPVRPLMHQPQLVIRENPHRLSSQDRKMDRAIPIETLTSTLANASPSERRAVEPEMTAKLTGMLLEMDQTEVLHLLESPHSLRAKVGEAMKVIMNAPQKL